MPRKRAIKTIEDLNAFNRKQSNLRRKKLQKAQDSPFTMKLAHRAMQRHQRRLDKDSRYFCQFPNYEQVILAAARKHSPLRRKQSQRNNRSQPRKNRPLNIGPPAPSVSGVAKRLPRTPISVIEKYVSKRIGSCKTLWNELRLWLPQQGWLLAHEYASKVDNRKNHYVFIVEGTQWSISYGQFQKLFTRVRKH